MPENRQIPPEQRAKISEATRAAMADPAVRKRISDRTKAGMRAAEAAAVKELKGLQRAWRAAGPAARRRFLADLLSIGGLP